MNEDIKRDWVDALNSGDYKQGKDALREGDKFCCLGVLCDLAVKAGIVKEESSTLVHTYYDGASAYLPLAVQKWADLPDGNPIVDGLNKRLSHLNDEGMPFPEIADIIKNEL